MKSKNFTFGEFIELTKEMFSYNIVFRKDMPRKLKKKTKQEFIIKKEQ